MKFNKARVMEQLKQPALLSERIQPMRRPVLRLKRPLRTNESTFTQVKQ